MSSIPSEKINELDFELIKKNFLSFVKNNSEFGDYDFEASGLNFLIDLLAYNTQYSAFYLNQVASEMFLDTAQRRKNVVSLAKQLGYTATSKVASEGKIQFTMKDVVGLNSAFSVPAKTKFIGTNVNGETYPFITLKDYSLNKFNGFSVEIDLIQGVLNTERVIVNQLLMENHFRINSTDVDIETLNVFVRENIQEKDSVRYTRVYDITLLDGSSKVYYLEQDYDGYYEIIFGDGVIGKEIKNNNVIDFEYIITSGASGNDCVSFDVLNRSQFTFNFFVTTTQYSTQGADEEGIESVRHQSRETFFSQNRAMTEQDYKTLLIHHFPYIDSISVWGGEKNDPPLYGEVFCAIKPISNPYLTETEKNNLLSKLDTLNMISTVPRIVDPQYIYIKIDANVVYNVLGIDMTEIEIVEMVENEVLNFNSTELQKFSKKFQVTNLTRKIDSLNQNFIGTDTTISLYQTVKIQTNVATSYVVNFNTKLRRGFLDATTFSYKDSIGNEIADCYLAESADFSKLQVKTPQGEVLVENIGTFDYDNGEIKLEAFIPTFVNNIMSQIEFNVRADTYVIDPDKDQILVIVAKDITVNPIAYLEETE